MSTKQIHPRHSLAGHSRRLAGLVSIAALSLGLAACTDPVGLPSGVGVGIDGSTAAAVERSRDLEQRDRNHGEGRGGYGGDRHF